MNIFNLPWRYLEMNPRLVENNMQHGIFYTSNELATSTVERMNACAGDNAATKEMFTAITAELEADGQTEILGMLHEIASEASILTDAGNKS